MPIEFVNASTRHFRHQAENPSDCALRSHNDSTKGAYEMLTRLRNDPRFRPDTMEAVMREIEYVSIGAKHITETWSLRHAFRRRPVEAYDLLQATKRDINDRARCYVGTCYRLDQPNEHPDPGSAEHMVKKVAYLSAPTMAPVYRRWFEVAVVRMLCHRNGTAQQLRYAHAVRHLKPHFDRITIGVPTVQRHHRSEVITSVQEAMMEVAFLWGASDRVF